MSPKPQAFPQMTMDKAIQECRPYEEERAVKEHCPVCTMQIILHCEDCKIQVTGCLCTEEANHGPEIARQRMIDRGIWLPTWGEKPEPGLIDPSKLHG